jgi:hypothetical protein
MVSESKALLFHLTNIHSYRLPKGSDVAEALQLMKYGIEIKAKYGPLYDQVFEMVQLYEENPSVCKELMDWFATQGLKQSLAFKQECMEQQTRRCRYTLVSDVLSKFNIRSEFGGISPKTGGLLGLVKAAAHCCNFVKLAASVIQSTQMELNANLLLEKKNKDSTGNNVPAARWSINRNNFEMKVHNALYVVLQGLLYNL